MKKRYLLNLLIAATASTALTAQAQNYGQQQQPYNQMQMQPQKMQQQMFPQQQMQQQQQPNFGAQQQISFLASDDGGVWQSAPQYSQPNAQALTVSAHGTTLLMQLYLNRQAGGMNAPLTFSVTNMQTNQQVASGTGGWSDANHIQFTYRLPDGTMDSGRWHVNHMPSNQQPQGGGYPQPNYPAPQTGGGYPPPPTYPNPQGGGQYPGGSQQPQGGGYPPPPNYPNPPAGGMQQPGNVFPTPPSGGSDVYPGASSMQTPSNNGGSVPGNSVANAQSRPVFALPDAERQKQIEPTVSNTFAAKAIEKYLKADESQSN